MCALMLVAKQSGRVFSKVKLAPASLASVSNKDPCNIKDR